MWKSNLVSTEKAQIRVWTITVTQKYYLSKKLLLAPKIIWELVDRAGFCTSTHNPLKTTSGSTELLLQTKVDAATGLSLRLSSVLFSKTLSSAQRKTVMKTKTLFKTAEIADPDLSSCTHSYCITERLFRVQNWARLKRLEIEEFEKQKSSPELDVSVAESMLMTI